MIYFAEAVGLGTIKIGYTAKDDAQGRMADMQTGCPVPLRVLAVMPGTLDDEKDLHRRFAAAHVTGAGKEWFKPVPELLAIIPTNGLPMCGSTEVTVKSVQIKVLTVGRKQFTKTLLKQLPILEDGQLFETSQFVERIKAALANAPMAAVVADPTIRFEFLPEYDYWGWTEGGFESEDCGREETQHEYENLILERGGTLFAYRLFHYRLFTKSLRFYIREYGERNPMPCEEAAFRIWQKCREVWVSEQHHLYIGV